MNYTQSSAVKARFYQAAGDNAQAIADAHRPKMFAKREEREEWGVHEDQARALRQRQSWAADTAATELLRAAGFGSLTRRK